MPVDEMLITAYHGDNSVFAVNLAPGRATVVLTRTNEQGETAVETTWKQTSDAFTALRDVLDRLVHAAPKASSQP
jgi:hypothetical protein